MTLLAVFSLNGCVTVVAPSGAVAPSKSTKKLYADVACDISGSVANDDQRREYVGPLETLCSTSLRGSRLTLYSFFHSPDQIAQVDVEDEDSTWPILKRKILEVEPNRKLQNTYFAPVLDRFIKDAKEHDDSPFVGLIFTDGQLFDKTETKAKAAELASLSNVKAIYMVPITYQPLELKRFMAPLGSKLILSTPDDKERGIADLNEVIKKAESN
jgi:hypothetical protein